jgi:hypothetical protein
LGDNEGDSILGFARGMRPTDHAMLLYTHEGDKRRVLFEYLRAGLDKGEGAAYVSSQEPPGRIRGAMQEHGMDVEHYEGNGGLEVIDYRDWYIIDGKFDMSKTLSLWEDLLENARAKGFPGLRVAGEMACFLENRMLEDLVAYECSLGRSLATPLTAICAYDLRMIAKNGGMELLVELLSSHSIAIIVGKIEYTKNVSIGDHNEVVGHFLNFLAKWGNFT